MTIKVILSLKIILQNCIESSQYVKIIGWGLLRLRVKWLVYFYLPYYFTLYTSMFEFEIKISFSLFTNKDAIKKKTPCIGVCITFCTFHGLWLVIVC